MTTDTQLAPTDAELMDLGHECELDAVAFGRAVLAKWGNQPVVAGEPVAPDFYTACAWYEGGGEGGWIALPGYSNETEHGVKHLVLAAARKEGYKGTASGRLMELGWEIRPVYLTPQPTQAQAGAVPLTDIRKAALDLYTPPFRHEYGYIRDANHQMVADDAGSEGTGLITSRIRGWGRIQYMDKPEQRAAALQDEVAEIVAEALNAYWSIHGIKGGQHGTDT